MFRHIIVKQDCRPKPIPRQAQRTWRRTTGSPQHAPPAGLEGEAAPSRGVGRPDALGGPDEQSLLHQGYVGQAPSNPYPFAALRVIRGPEIPTSRARRSRATRFARAVGQTGTADRTSRRSSLPLGFAAIRAIRGQKRSTRNAQVLRPSATGRGGGMAVSKQHADIWPAACTARSFPVKLSQSFIWGEISWGKH